MASGAKKGGGGGDVILESRHLVGLFLMMVVIFGVVFVLGYELGRNQVSGQARASDAQTEEHAGASGVPAIVPPASPAPMMQPNAPPKTAPTNSSNANPKNSGAKNGATKAPAANIVKNGTKPPSAPPAKTTTPKSQPVAPANNRAAQPPTNAVRNAPAPAAGTVNSPLIPKGSVVLQVSALTVESDALKMAQELQKKKFPAFVLAPGADHFYRVQVGPFTDAKSADKARAALEKEGFKPIVKH
jgi:cell division septation protein DedD